MTQLGAAPYHIDRSSRRCAVTGRALEPGEVYIAALVEQPPVGEDGGGEPGQEKKNSGSTGKMGGGETGAPWRRVDVCLEAWERGPKPQHLFGFWKTRVPKPTEKKRLFVSDELLMDLFLRLGDRDEAQQRAFRFVLGLILMRKKLLVYESTEKRAGPSGEQEWWRLTVKAGAATGQGVDVLNPRLDEGQVRGVGEQLSQILEEQA